MKQLIKAYHHGHKEKEKQLQEFIHEKQAAILHVHLNRQPQRLASSSLHQKRRMIQNALDTNDNSSKQPQRAASSSTHQKRRMIQNALDMNDNTSSEDDDLVLSSSSEDQIDLPLKKVKSSRVFLILIFLCSLL